MSDLYHRIILAPVAGVTDRATRAIAREFGCPLAFSELISAAGLSMRGRGTETMLESCRDEHPLVIQLFGKEAGRLGEATRIVDSLGPDGIDLNLGCPTKSVVKHGSGMALTRDLKRVAEVIAAMRRNTSLPLSIKIRAGWTHEDLNFLEIGRIAQEEGVDGVILHARTRAMGFSGQAYWPWIAELKAAVSIPVVGNGDVIDGPSAARMLGETGCDGIMVGRASFGNPWIFPEIQHYSAAGEIAAPSTLRTRVDVLTRHLRYAVEDKGERRGVLEMRKQVGWYLKGFPNVKELRQVVNRLERLEEITTTIQAWADGLPVDLVPLCSETERPLPDRSRLALDDMESFKQVGNLQKVKDHLFPDLA